MTTIQDVAKHAQVGVATVSRVLNGTGYVKDSTKERVLQAIKELNYTPNEMAKNLFHRRSGIVAVIVPEVSHPFFAEFLNATEVALYDYGYQMMICNTWREQNYEKKYLEMLKQQRVDGLIFCAHTLDTESYQSTDRPIVSLDRDLGRDIPYVTVNHEKGGRLAAQALIDAGCKNVVQCTGQESVNSLFNERHEVFEQCLKKNGVVCHNFVTEWNKFEPEYYEQIAEEIASEYEDADGFFATDVIALMLIKAAMKKGRRFPQDFKVVAYDGTFASNIFYPSVTTIEQPIRQLSKECVHLIMQLISGNKVESRKVQLDVKVREGASTIPF